MKPQKIRARIFLPLGLSFFAILTLTVYGIFEMDRRDKDDFIRGEISELKSIFHHEIKDGINFMGGIIGIIKENKNLQNAWLSKDRDELLRITSSLESGISPKLGITHFYFHNLDKTCFLRVHNPTLCGDKINRYTLDQTVRSELPSSGIELGPLGTLTLRNVHPWLINGELTGYIELGLEVGKIKEKVIEYLDIELVSLLCKENLDRERWVEGQKMLDRNGNWDQFEYFVISGSTLNPVPLKLTEYLKNLESINNRRHLNSIISIPHEGRKFRGGFEKLTDPFNRDIGNFILLVDVTETVASSQRVAILLIILAATLYGLLFGFFWFFLGSVEKHLGDSIAKIKILHGLIPICSTCNKIRDDSGSWKKLEYYISEHSEAEFTHGICKDCLKEHYSEFLSETEKDNLEREEISKTG